MTAKEKLLSLSKLIGFYKAKEHFLSITGLGGKIIYIPIENFTTSINMEKIKSDVAKQKIGITLNTKKYKANIKIIKLRGNINEYK